MQLLCTYFTMITVWHLKFIFQIRLCDDIPDCWSPYFLQGEDFYWFRSSSLN